MLKYVHDFPNIILNKKDSKTASKLFVNEFNYKFGRDTKKKVSFQYYVDGQQLEPNDYIININPNIKSPIIFSNYEKSSMKKIKLRFTIDYKTEFGDNLFIVGSIPEFGMWNTQNAYKMQYVDGKDYNWQAEIEYDCLPEIIVYRYFCVFKDTKRRFESGQVRTVKLSELLSCDPQGIIEFNDQWRDYRTKSQLDSFLISDLLTKESNLNHIKLIFYAQYDIKDDRNLSSLSKNKYNLSIVGDIPQLGEWEPEKRIPLFNSKDSNLWVGSIEIDINNTQRISFTYKLILNILNNKDPKRVYEFFWQLGDNSNYSSEFSNDNKQLTFVIDIGRVFFDIETGMKKDDIPFHANLLKIAKETEQIIYSRRYNPKGSSREINIQREFDQMMHGTRIYRPDYEFVFDNSITSTKRNDFCKVEVVNESTFESAFRIQNDLKIKDVCVLNFASATKPGGGFLNGRQAQEESLARSSMLYASLKTQTEMYRYHKRNYDPFYTDYMIYSPKVPVIRNNNGDLIYPYYVSVISSAAVNFNEIINNYEDQKYSGYDDDDDNYNDNSSANNSSGYVSNNSNDADSSSSNIFRDKEFIKLKKDVEDTMFERCKKILQLAIHKRNRAVVLGAFGCGVFKNDPHVISNIFRELLFGRNYEYAKYFDYVAFAILKGKKDSTLFNIFENTFRQTDEL